MAYVLERPRTNKVISGVCEAVAGRFGRRGWSVRLFALLWTVFFFWLTIPIYLTLWIVIPLADEEPRE